MAFSLKDTIESRAKQNCSHVALYCNWLNSGDGENTQWLDQMATYARSTGAPDYPDRHTGYTVLHQAAAWKEDTNPSALRLAIRAFITKGADINRQSYPSDKESTFVVESKQPRNYVGHQTPLHVAANNSKYGNVVTKELIDKGANPNMQDAKGYTPLHRAVRSGNHAVVLSLLEGDADPNIQDAGGYTPLHHAASIGNHIVIPSLISQGADVNAMNPKGYHAIQTPLYLATQEWYHIHCTGAGSPRQNQRQERLADTMRILIQHGANPRLRGVLGKSPIDILAGYECTEKSKAFAKELITLYKNAKQYYHDTEQASKNNMFYQHPRVPYCDPEYAGEEFKPPLDLSTFSIRDAVSASIGTVITNFTGTVADTIQQAASSTAHAPSGASSTSSISLEP